MAKIGYKFNSYTMTKERSKTLRRVVITGIGCVSPNGLGRKSYWEALAAGRSGVAAITSFSPHKLDVKIAGEVKGLDVERYLPVKDRKHVSRTVLLALAAASEAWQEAGLGDLTLAERQRVGVMLGTGGGALEFSERQYAHYYAGEVNKASIYSIPSSTAGTISSEISMRFQLRGPSHVISTGCTSSTDAIGYGALTVALGRADCVLAGGADAPIMPGIMTGFEMMKVLTTAWNAAPEQASRPFSRDRSGMVLAEGAWFFVLEDESRARARGARVYAEVAGYGTTCDAHHRVRLDESGAEPARAMQLAIEDAGLDATAVEYINLHGTATQLNDAIETRALKNCFGQHAYRIPMSATKSLIGHPQGASGAAGVAATLMGLTEGIIHPTANLSDPDPVCDLDYVPLTARRRDIEIALCNCIGFGSKNSALVLRRI